MTGEELAARAERLAGAPFRLGGRDRQTGLDCVGVVALALGQRDSAPTGYGFRNSTVEQFLPRLDDAGFERLAQGAKIQPGDVLLSAPGPAQHHLAIALSGNRLVHAHAGLRRVVVQPAPLPWPVIGHWRLASMKD